VYKRSQLIRDKLMSPMGDCGLPFTRGFFSPMDLAGALRGEGLYFDFYDDPDELRGLLDYCADATIRFAEDIYALAERRLGNTKYGTFYCATRFNMSEEISWMISASSTDVCRARDAKGSSTFCVGHMHTTFARHYLSQEICALKNVANLWLATDPNQPRPMSTSRNSARTPTASASPSTAKTRTKSSAISTNSSTAISPSACLFLPMKKRGPPPHGLIVTVRGDKYETQSRALPADRRLSRGFVRAAFFRGARGGQWRAE
jgi:hypothetical protein